MTVTNVFGTRFLPFCVGLVLASLALAEAEIECKIITCSSIGFKPAACNEGTGVVSVTLVKQISKSPCIEGVTWDYEEPSIVVTDGCRAKFNVCREMEKPKPIEKCICVKCESWQFKPDSCKVDFIISSMKLKKQISYTKCDKAKYSFKNDTIFVDKGCRGLFNVCHVCEPKCIKVICQSWKFQDATCPVDGGTIVSVEVDTQLSNSACTFGTSFFNEGTAIKVTNGCRAVFEVCFEDCK